MISPKKLQSLRKSFVLYTIAVTQLLLVGCTANNSRLSITTNQQYIEQTRQELPSLDDIPGVFKVVFDSLPDEVTVYPTENYYYFKTFTNHRELWGNLRLDSIDRDKGLLDFAYFEVHGQTDPYFNYSKSWHKKFGQPDQVFVQKNGSVEYSVTAFGKTVLFKLNPIKQELPSGITLRDGEEFISRNFDESGFQFVLLFDNRRNAFRYVLDESAPLPDQLLPFGKDVFVGLRSGFAFYQEPDINRKLFFAVDEQNVNMNNYYDGPFDQLADNFVDVQRFEKLVTLAYPFYAGKVKGRGDFVDDKGARTDSRVLISAYFTYKSLRELWARITECQKLFSEQPDQSACIGRDEKGLFSNMVERKLSSKR